MLAGLVLVGWLVLAGSPLLVGSLVLAGWVASVWRAAAVADGLNSVADDVVGVVVVGVVVVTTGTVGRGSANSSSVLHAPSNTITAVSVAIAR